MERCRGAGGVSARDATAPCRRAFSVPYRPRFPHPLPPQPPAVLSRMPPTPHRRLHAPPVFPQPPHATCPPPPWRQYRHRPPCSCRRARLLSRARHPPISPPVLPLAPRPAAPFIRHQAFSNGHSRGTAPPSFPTLAAPPRHRPRRPCPCWIPGHVAASWPLRAPALQPPTPYNR